MENAEVSPGLMSRPSLSGLRNGAVVKLQMGVAGADVPAFVERSRCRRLSSQCRACVAGADVPAFVERWTGDRVAS